MSTLPTPAERDEWAAAARLYVDGDNTRYFPPTLRKQAERVLTLLASLKQMELRADLAVEQCVSWKARADRAEKLGQGWT